MNYDVKMVSKTINEEGKEIKKTEQILVIGAVSCADAEYVVMTEKANHVGSEVTIVSSKETKLSLFETPESDSIDESYYKVTVLYAVGGDGDKLKFERESKLILSKSAADAIKDMASRDEVIAVSKSRIVEVIKAPNKGDVITDVDFEEE